MPIVVDAANEPWEPRTIAPTGAPAFRKNLYTDPDTGMEVRLVKYPAGTMNPTHTHPCAHGMYILEGTLVTNAGSFGPGAFVWFPEGETMAHGATAETDVVVVFITNKPFRIDYQ
jgi:quercetin dioxygenase-like cupin family protein